MATAGYSGTPLARKLGIKEGFTVWFVNPPDHYFQLFSEFPTNLITQSTSEKDFIHYFAHSAAQLHNELPGLKTQLKLNGMLWISWPKKSSKIESDLDGNIVRSMGLHIGLVDIKVCAVDQDWSALKFVIPLKDRS